MAKASVDVGDRKFLVFDNGLFQESTGFTAVLRSATRREHPVLVPDRPWEVGGIRGDSNISFMEDAGLYKMWYVVEHIDPSKAMQQGRGVASGGRALGGVLDAKTLADLRGAERLYALCYAISEDGCSWTKPSVGVVDYGGNRNNNMVFVGRLGCTVFRDPSAPAAERYKMIYGGGPRLPHMHLLEDIPVQKIYHAIYGAHSPDGIHWTSYPEPIVPWYTDTTNVAYWDDRIGKYVAFVCANEGMIYREGQTVTPDVGSRLRYRAIGRAETTDFGRFPAPTRIMEPTPSERRCYRTGVDYYNSAAVKYPYAADSYFLFSSSFYHEPDTLDVHLCTSRDGVSYSRWRDPFLGLGLDGAFDSKSIYMGAGVARQGDQIMMLYAGYSHEHGKSGSAPPFSGAVGLARVCLDRFVAQEARWSGGTLTTVPLEFSGRRMAINMDAHAGGRLKVEMLDPSGKPIEGYTRRDADWLWGNDIRREVTWRSSNDVSSLRGRVVRLRIVGKAARLYAFQFAD